jgi:plastocyanin
MKRNRLLAVAGLVLVTLSASMVACGKDKSTNPGGGGGGGGLELNSGNVATGTNFMHTFASAGSFPYHCTIHGAMTGTVTVAAGQSMNATVTIVNSTSTGFSPQAISVAPGGTVTWNNTSGVTHTVTSN